jgi:hypothetical protein
MADLVFNSYKADLLNGAIAHASATIKCALVTSSYTPNRDTHDFFNDVTNEVVGTGYTAGGAALANKTVTIDNTDDEGVFDADDTSWATSTITARGAVIYKDTGTPSTSPLMCYFDFGADKSSSGGTFQITWHSEGIINIGTGA